MQTKSKNKRTTILKAALESFSVNGFHSSPISLIAKKAQVGAGTIYRYFASKDDLIKSLYEELDKEFRPSIEEGWEEKGSVRQNLLKILANLFQYLISHPAEFKFLEQYYHSPYGMEKKREEDRPLHTLFSKGIEEGKLKELPEDILCALCIGPIVYLARDYMQGSLVISEEMMQATLDGCWDAIRK